MFSYKYKKYFALMAALLAFGPCVADAPRVLAGWYSPDDWENSDISEFRDTYRDALEMAQGDDDLQQYDRGAGDALEAAEQMESDFWSVLLLQISLGDAFRISILVLLLSVAMRLYLGIPEKRVQSGPDRDTSRLGLAATVAVVGLVYAFSIPILENDYSFVDLDSFYLSSGYYFTLTVFLVLVISSLKKPASVKACIYVALTAAIFWFFTAGPSSAEVSNGHSLYSQIVSARISRPLNLLLAFLSDILFFVVPFYFLTRFGIEGGFSRISTP